MKKFFGWFVLLAAMLTGCTETQPVMHEIAPFHYVMINGRRTKTNLTLLQMPDTWQIGIVSRHTDSLTYFVRNDTLHLRVPQDVRYHYNITLCAPEYRTIEAYLLNSLCTPDTLRQDTIMVKTDFIKTVRLNVQVSQLRALYYCNLKNKDMYFAGTADVAYFGNKYSAVNIDASHLKTKDLHLYMLEGNAKINVSDHLWIHEAFQSKITYVGSPVIEECNLQWSILSNAFFFY